MSESCNLKCQLDPGRSPELEAGQVWETYHEIEPNQVTIFNQQYERRGSWFFCVFKGEKWKPRFLIIIFHLAPVANSKLKKLFGFDKEHQQVEFNLKTTIKETPSEMFSQLIKKNPKPVSGFLQLQRWVTLMSLLRSPAPSTCTSSLLAPRRDRNTATRRAASILINSLHRTLNQKSR